MAWKAVSRPSPEPPPAAAWSPTPLMAALAFGGWLVVTFCAPALGMVAMPGEWYAELAKPWWNPPAWLFGPVWTLLYLLMAVAAWLVWRRGGWPARRSALAIYLVQLLLNAAWSPVFFGLQNPGLALLVILALLAAIVATLRAFHPVSRTAALLLLPYLLWVNFATVLNLTLWFMNR